VVLAAALLAAAAVGSISAEAAEGGAMERTVSVSATGIAKVEPDVAHISTGVVTEAPTAKEAMDRNGTVMARLVDGLKKGGVEARDIKTTALTVEPRYTQPKDGRPAGISGYRVLNQVRLTVRNVSRLGTILDEAIVLGANQINQIAFDVADSEVLKDDARRQAMANARRRAELYAKAAGADLGQVLRISESVSGSPPVLFGRFSGGAGVPVEPGTRSLEVEVHVTYELK
jgi:uncharacterized protein YggE